MKEAARRMLGSLSWMVPFSLKTTLALAAENATTTSDGSSKENHDGVSTVTVTFRVLDHIEYWAPEKSQVVVSCLANDIEGTKVLEARTLKFGEEHRWYVYLVDDGFKIVSCRFAWTWKKNEIRYNILDSKTEIAGRIYETVWSVTEVGLCRQASPDPSPVYKFLVPWSPAA